MRHAGKIPAILYGHGKENVSLAVVQEDVAAALRHGAKVVDLAGGVNEPALIREVQWDTYGVDVLHVDFARVEAGETVDTTLPLVLHGEAPGTHEGGMVELIIHEIHIRCPVDAIPDKLELNVKTLHVGHALYARDIILPPGAEVAGDPDVMVTHCVAHGKVLDEEEEEEVEKKESAEPEVIGRKAEEGEETTKSS